MKRSRWPGRLIADEQAALDAMVREELGLDPSELGGSPYAAAVTSFALFALGAIVPLIPYFFAAGAVAVGAAIACAALDRGRLIGTARRNVMTKKVAVPRRLRPPRSTAHGGTLSPL